MVMYRTLQRKKESVTSSLNKYYAQANLPVGSLVKVGSEEDGLLCSANSNVQITQGEIDRGEWVILDEKFHTLTGCPDAQVEQGGALHPRGVQAGGDHYKSLNHQPLEVVLGNEGYEAFRGACLVNIYKYIGYRNKGGLYKEDLRKAQHIIQWLLTETPEDKKDAR